VDFDFGVGFGRPKRKKRSHKPTPPISQVLVETAAAALDTTTYCVASKLRRIGYDVVLNLEELPASYAYVVSRFAEHVAVPPYLLHEALCRAEWMVFKVCHSVFACSCLRVFVSSCIRVFLSSCVRGCVCACVRVCTCARAAYARVFEHVCVCVCAFVRLCVCAWLPCR
jgi:hypothetical protein